MSTLRPTLRGLSNPSRAAVQASMRAQAPVVSTPRIDVWIANRLERPDLYQGAPTPSDRMERQRREIVRQGVADHRVVGASTETWAAMFERLHGEPL